MAIVEGTFEAINPFRFTAFTFPNPDYRHNTKKPNNFYNEFLRIAVLDSPAQTAEPKIAAMLVPKNREQDWIFCTENGHFQLLFSSQVARLILIGNLPCETNPPKVYRFSNKGFNRSRFEKSLNHLLLALSPKFMFGKGLPSIPLVSYEDGVVQSSVVEICTGPVVGKMLIEDIELILDPRPEFFSKRKAREFRRRLRFERMPNLVQTEISLIPAFADNVGDFEIEAIEFRLELKSLVHPYLPPMVASLALVGLVLEDCCRFGSRPRFLCIGIGGGALLMFLHNHFEFDILGVEIDELVLKNAKRFFGLIESEFLRVHVGDGIKVMKDVAWQAMRHNLVPVELSHLWNQTVPSHSSSNGFLVNPDIGKNFENENAGSFLGGDGADLEMGKCPIKVGDADSLIHVIMIDIDSGNAKDGVSAPPLDFIQKPVILAAKMALHKLGILVINILPPSRSFYNNVVCAFREVFPELYEIAVGNDENYVLVAAASPITSVTGEHFIFEKLNHDIFGSYINKIKKI